MRRRFMASNENSINKKGHGRIKNKIKEKTSPRRRKILFIIPVI
jgi:hypothetical protein